MFTVTSKGHKGDHLHWARKEKEKKKEIQSCCVYHNHILMSGILNHIQRQNVCEMHDKMASRDSSSHP